MNTGFIVFNAFCAGLAASGACISFARREWVLFAVGTGFTILNLLCVAHWIGLL